MYRKCGFPKSFSQFQAGNKGYPMQYFSTVLWKVYPVSPSFSLMLLVRFHLMCTSADLKTDWKQFPIVVISIQDYTQFYWKLLSEFVDYTGLVLFLYLFFVSWLSSNTMTWHTEEQCFLQLDTIQNLWTWIFCQPQCDEKEETLKIWHIHSYLKPTWYMSLKIK